MGRPRSIYRVAIESQLTRGDAVISRSRMNRAGRSADNSHNAKGKRGGTGSGRASQQRRGPQHKPARTRGPKGAGSRYGPRPDGEQRGGGQRGTGQRNSGQRSADQQDYDGPQIADDIRAGDLDRSVRQSLSNVPPKLAERVAR